MNMTNVSDDMPKLTKEECEDVKLKKDTKRPRSSRSSSVMP